MQARLTSAMIFAAGFGTRMAPLTNTKPKPLIEVNGQSLIDHTFMLARRAGVTNFVVNAHHLADQVVDHFDHVPDVRVVVEAPKILDTGGGLKAAEPYLEQDAVFTSNSDAIWMGQNPFNVLKANWDGDRMGALLLLVPSTSAIGHAGSGDFAIDSEGRLSRNSQSELTFSGVQIILKNEANNVVDDVFSLNVVWDKLALNGRLFGCVYDGKWADVGSVQGIHLAEEMLAHSDV